MCAARSIFELFLVSHAMGGKQLVILVICMLALGILFDEILTSKYLEIAIGAKLVGAAGAGAPIVYLVS